MYAEIEDSLKVEIFPSNFFKFNLFDFYEIFINLPPPHSLTSLRYLSKMKVGNLKKYFKLIQIILSDLRCLSFIKETKFNYLQQKQLPTQFLQPPSFAMPSQIKTIQTYYDKCFQPLLKILPGYLEKMGLKMIVADQRTCINGAAEFVVDTLLSTTLSFF